MDQRRVGNGSDRAWHAFFTRSRVLVALCVCIGLAACESASAPLDDLCRASSDVMSETVRANGNANCRGIPTDPDGIYPGCVSFVNDTIEPSGCVDVYRDYLTCVASQAPVCPDAYETCTDPFYLRTSACVCMNPPTEALRQWCVDTCNGTGC